MELVNSSADVLGSLTCTELSCASDGAYLNLRILTAESLYVRVSALDSADPPNAHAVIQLFGCAKAAGNGARANSVAGLDFGSHFAVMELS